ncbi:MAG: NAD+ synthase [Nitrospirae bacterium]|nr:MAG: NAD+ synthase [Nitrospirota bacterium]
MAMLRIAMVQMNALVGDVEGNVRAVLRWIKEARKASADIVAFPELVVTGYPPEDLLLKPQFIHDAERAVERIARSVRGIVAVIGCVLRGKEEDFLDNGVCVGPKVPNLANAAVVVAQGRIVGIYRKQLLPNYGVFDERRYFRPGRHLPVFVINDSVVGVNICEDIWFADGPTRAQVQFGGAELILNINASPFHAGKSKDREAMLVERARENRVIVSYTNMVGGQDELIFDGNSLLIDQTGHVIGRAAAFEEDWLLADIDCRAVRAWRSHRTLSSRRSARVVERIVVAHDEGRRIRSPVAPALRPQLGRVEEVYRALVLGVTDYVRKNRFRSVVIGLSGGIDSTLTAMIACDAIGASNVVGVFMPSPYTSRESREDVRALASALQVPLVTIPITNIFRAYLRNLRRPFQGLPEDVTEENIQARIRGNILMALSNKFGHLVLTTGNKSELSVGYATLYGDMAGGFAVIKDVLKTLVYELTRWRMHSPPLGWKSVAIPPRILERAPSAELRPDQTDQDTLPPYAVLDPIVKGYVEEDRSAEDIAAMGFSLKVVRRVIEMIDRNEYKRRQAPIGVKITPRAFGKDRRMPITNRYSG